MSSIDTGAAPIVLSSRPTRSAEVSKRNQYLGWACIAILAIAPLPLGSHRPFLWLVWGAILGLIAMVYGFSVIRGGRPTRFSLASVAVSTVLFVLFALYLIVQVLPLGLAAPITVGDVTLPLSSLSITPTNTVLMLVRQVTYAVFAYFILEVTVRESRRLRMLNAILLIICAYALWGLVSLRLGDTILGVPKWAYLGSVTSTYVNRNSFATLLAFGIAIAVGFLLTTLLSERGGEREARQRNVGMAVVYALALVLLVTTVIATQSRMGLFVSVAGAVAVLICGVLRLTVSRRAAVALALGSLMVLAIGLVLFGQGLFNRLSTLELSSEVRSTFYVQVIELIMQRPWTGFGGGSFEQAFQLVHQSPVNPELVWDRAHNTYFTLWAETGLIFGSLPIIIFAIAFFRILVGQFRSAHWLEGAIAVAVLVAGGLHSLVDFSLEIQANTFVFIALVAIGLNASLRRSRSE